MTTNLGPFKDTHFHPKTKNSTASLDLSVSEPEMFHIINEKFIIKTH